MYIKKIFNQSLLYGIGSSFTSLVSFLVLPVYTRLLSVQDFGTLSLILTAVFLLQYVYNMGVYSGFMIRYFDFKAQDYISHKRLTSTILFFYLSVSVLASLFIYLFLGPTLRFFIGTQDKLAILFIVLISSCEILYNLPTVIMRLEERVITFVSVNFIKSFALLVTVFLALRFTNGGVNAALTAQFAVTLCATAFAYLLTYRHYGFIFDIDEFKKSARLGLPFLIVMLSFWLIDSANKFIIKYFLTLTDVALYSLGFKIGQVVLFTVTVFQLVWQPMMFRIASNENGREIFGKIFNYFALIIFTISLAVSLFSRQLILIFSTTSYVSAYTLVSLIVFAYAFYGLLLYLLTPLIIKKRTFLLMLICVGGTVFNIIANLVAIPLYGITGAAYATFITYFVMGCTFFFVSQKIYYISYNLSKFSKIAFGIFLILILGRLGDTYHLLGVLSKITLIFLFFAILLFAKFFDEKDILFLRERLKSFCRFRG